MPPDNENIVVEVSLDDVLRVRRLLEELVSFLHQPLHYQENEEVIKWLKGGVYSELVQVFYKVTWDWLTEDEKSKIENA